MRAVEPIHVTHLFAPLNDELIALLRSLTPEEWNAPTVAGAWTVKDVAAHLLDTELRRLSMHRDGYEPPLPPDAFANGISGFVNGMNADGVALLRRVSPALLIDLHARYGPQMAEFFATLDPFAAAKWSVSWAGEEGSQNWFDVARELTERWHHQQQIRDATGRPALYDRYLAPVLETFVRAVPFAYREAEGGPVVLRIDEGVWSLVEGKLYVGAAESPSVTVGLTGDVAWRLFTRQKIDPRAVVEGDARLAEPLLKMVAII
ncbi:MAG TPA: maleylpyruvate isomerase N-terminal domain-containing protein [Thermoanaerobaculia bacterium]|nr:maleylpyruvate isomerase N-terminal domain-containing protein [Thermoanaerobaculia bacterium]